MYGTVHVTVHDTVHIDGSMTWHWPMMWHWLMRCHDPIGLKFLCTVDWWRGSIWVDQKSHVRYMHYTRLFSTKPRHCSSWVKLCYRSNRIMLTNDVAHSWASKLFLIRWPWFTQCIYKKGASPPPLNLISLNPFLDSIFCNSFSILYFLRILINFLFAPSSIMSRQIIIILSRYRLGFTDSLVQGYYYLAR